MPKRSGLMSIGIALIILLFTMIAAMVIYNISSNLYKNMIKMDERRKESQYKKTVILSLKNVTDYINSVGTIDGTDTQIYFNNLSDSDRKESVDFSFRLSSGLVGGSEDVPFPARTIVFPATVTLSATTIETGSATLNFFELFTKPDYKAAGLDYTEDTYGIIVQEEVQ